VKKATSTNPIIIHDDIYMNWVFSENGPTQGRRFIKGLELIKARYPDLDIRGSRSATWDELRLVHTDEYTKSVIFQHKSDQWAGEREDLSRIAKLFVGGTVKALWTLYEGETLTAIHLPGAKHHAQADRSSGFCVFADFAIAAILASRRGYRVAILDIDAHHGDGTENLCADDPNILTFSVHEENIFPWTGLVDDPERNIYNQPLKAGDGDVELFFAVDRFNQVAREFKPDLIFIAAGADGHRDDPLANLNYETGGFFKALGNLRFAFPSTPVLMGGAGGYKPDDATPAMWAIAAQTLVDGSVLADD
jgi:acetoin utilization protein AcuC